MASASDEPKAREVSNEREERKELKYKGVRRRSWGKWISEIRVSKKKSRLWLGSYDSPHKAARAYDAAALCLKGPSALLNFPHAAHTLPRPTQSLPRDIQSAASKAAQTFDEHRMLLLSLPSEAQSSKPPEEKENCCESGQENDRILLSMGEVGPGEDLIFESPDMMQKMAEALLITPPPVHDYDDGSKPVEPLYPLWND
ncbi:hypothetical protein SUGI_0906830 [Cryptomeria japonica]|uniref:ethylene-responsive transcription factor ERF024-like n=1 Tax=Cryptomeria japonica TaxID=3369 RepID=UPI002414B72B|nr:ethylene-responsive transcription factor ERF024-like [Cryptomeria japonica]GLJ43576.1 hypothetical protein SUGI_0906830 [Cryptomeria japonica]